MNLDALLASLAPDGASDPAVPPPTLGGSSLPTLPSPASALLASAPTVRPSGAVSAAMAPGAVHPVGNGLDWQAMLPQLIAGLLSGVALKDAGPYGRGPDIGGFAQGLLHGYHTAQQGKLAQQQSDLAGRRMTLEEQRAQQTEQDRQDARTAAASERTLRHQELSANFVMNAVKGAEPFKDDPASWASYVAMMDGIGAKVFGLAKGALSSQLQYPDSRRGKQAQKDAAGRVEALSKMYGEDFWKPEVQDATTTFNDTPVKVRDLVALSELQITKGAPVVGPQLPGTEPPLVTPSPKDEPLDRQVLRAYAKTVNKSVADLSPADIKAARDAAGVGADPEMRGLTKELAQQRLKDLKDKGAGVAAILEGTPDYKRAENVAYGRLTLSQLRGLYSGREAKGKEMLRAVLDKAEEINPDFNAALFEQGYKFASNPKTQMAMVALNRVEPNVDKLIELSDQWDRTKYPTVNDFLRAVKFQWGNRAVSDFGQLQTIVGDELGPALGVGQATDLKTKLGLEMAGGSKGQENFRSSMLLVKDALKNQRRALLGQMGPYGQGKNEPPPASAPRVNPFRRPQ